MKHAGPETLRRLAPLLGRLRCVPGLVERKPGTFYFRSAAFLHFHEDPAGIFADAKLNGSFERMPLHTLDDEAAFIEAVFEALARLHSHRAGRRGSPE